MASYYHQQQPGRPSTSQLQQALDDEELNLNEKTSENHHDGLPLPATCRHEPSRCPDCQKRRNLQAWIPIIAYALSTLGFLVAIGWYRDELFTGLDALSTWLKEPSNHGELVLFGLIFITCIPPIPLYSTLILLAGYTFGSFNGFLISYTSALTGALAVFLISRTTFCLPHIHSFFAASPSSAKAIRAIERNPKLFLAVRVAPYPYNVMNVLLAGAEGMSLRCYGGITALSLLKISIHTSLGASLRHFSSTQAANEEENWLGKVYTVVGLVMCFVIFVYLAWVVRRKVDGELENDRRYGNDEERTAFLADGEEMEEVR